MTQPILHFDQISVRFGGVVALDGVGFDIARGDTFGIIGPNGAGKTTLFNCISGFIKPEAGGRIDFNGKNLIGRSVHEVAKLGISRSFQNIALMHDLTGRQNILTGLHLRLAYHPLASILPLRRVADAEAQAARQIEKICDLLKISGAVLDTRVDALPLGQQKKIEVARAVVRAPELLLLDEPAGGLNDRETADLIGSLESLRASSELTIVVIDHDMNLVMDLCDQLAVLDFGKLIAIGAAAEVQDDPAVIAVYLGEQDAA